MKTPCVFISHGSPMAALEDDDYTRALASMGSDLPRPRAIVIVSAHWESAAPLRVTASERPSTIYDFSGFPEELHRLFYPCPGDPRLAAEIVNLLSEAGLGSRLDPKRGLDHGAWVPMMRSYPHGKIPVVEVALPIPRTGSEILKVGRALRPLRERGILLVGSGGIVHNLRLLRWADKGAPVEPWARRFDDWVRARLDRLEVEKILNYREEAPECESAVPTTEHFDPLFFVLGAAREDERVTDVFEGFQYGNLSLRTFWIG